MEVTFEGKTFVVLGHLSTITKREAWIKVIDLGGQVSNTPRPSSDYFIQGERVSAKRQARAEELGYPILSEREFLDAVRDAQAEEDGAREHVQLGDAIASFRGLFDGPASLRTWEKVTELLDGCPEEQLEDACTYVESHVSRWPDHRSSPSAPSMCLTEHAFYNSQPDDPLGDVRVALKPWLNDLLQGATSPKFELARRVQCNGLGLNGTILTHLVENPTLVNLRELDVGQANNATQTFYKKLRTSRHLPSLDTLTLRTMSVKHAGALCGEHTLDTLRWVTLGYPGDGYTTSELDAIYSRLFEATWWTQIEGLNLQLSRMRSGIVSGIDAYGALSSAAGNLPSLRHLVLGDAGGVEKLFDSPLLTQLDRLSFHTCRHPAGIELLRHLDEHSGHSIQVIDLSRSAFHSYALDRYAHHGKRAYIECLLDLKNLDVYDEIVLPGGERDEIEGALESRAKDAGVVLTPSPMRR